MKFDVSLKFNGKKVFDMTTEQPTEEKAKEIADELVERYKSNRFTKNLDLTVEVKPAV